MLDNSLHYLYALTPAFIKKTCQRITHHRFRRHVVKHPCTLCKMKPVLSGLFMSVSNERSPRQESGFDYIRSTLVTLSLISLAAEIEY